MIDLTPLIQAAITLAVAAVTAFVIPWLKSKTSAERWNKYLGVIDVLVGAAEQMYGVGEGEKKMEQVQKWLEDRGYTFDLKDVEAAVLKLHADGYNYSNAHSEAEKPPDAA
jgi:hypothetical protein